MVEKPKFPDWNSKHWRRDLGVFFDNLSEDGWNWCRANRKTDDDADFALGYLEGGMGICG